MASKIQCDLCPSTLSTKQGFHRHNESHHENRKVLFCRMDFQYFTDPSKLEKHWFEFHKIKSVTTCAVCDKTFTSKRTRLQHFQKVHETETQVACKICDKVLSTSWNLTVHIRNMHGNSNKKIQTGSCTCEQCGKIFDDGWKLNLHTKVSHSKKHKCDKCNETFDTQKRLKHHFVLEHSSGRVKAKANHDPLKCKTCNPQNVTSQAKLESNKCDLCGEMFEFESELFEHVQNHLVEEEQKKSSEFNDYRSEVEFKGNTIEFVNVFSQPQDSENSTSSGNLEDENASLRTKISELNNLVESLKTNLHVVTEENVKLLWENRRFRQFCKCE